MSEGFYFFAFLYIIGKYYKVEHNYKMSQFTEIILGVNNLKTKYCPNIDFFVPIEYKIYIR